MDYLQVNLQCSHCRIAAALGISLDDVYVPCTMAR